LLRTFIFISVLKVHVSNLFTDCGNMPSLYGVPQDFALERRPAARVVS